MVEITSMDGRRYAARDATARGGWRWVEDAADGTAMSDGEAEALIGALSPFLYRLGPGAFFTKVGIEP